MKKEIKTIYKFELIICFFIFLLFFIQNAINRNIISIIGLGIILLILSVVYKRKRDTNFYRGTALRIVISVLLFYFILILTSGIFLGFNKTLFSTNINIWFQGFIPEIIITIFLERIRYILIKNNSIDKKGIIVITLLSITYNIIMSLNIGSINNLYEVFLFVSRICIPIIAREMLTSYIVYKYGFLPGITYKLVMNLYVYVIPIETNLGDYLYSAINLLIPFTIYMVLQKYIKDNDDLEAKKTNLNKIRLNFVTIPIIVFLLMLIILVSGVSKYQMIAIASNSMEPTYERGDAIIFERCEKDDIEIGDIIVLKKDNILIAHRVIKIKEDSVNLYFYTKGDANNSPDSEITKDENVLRSCKKSCKIRRISYSLGK